MRGYSLSRGSKFGAGRSWRSRLSPPRSYRKLGRRDFDPKGSQCGRYGPRRGMTRNIKMSWTDERIEQMRKMWEKGLKSEERRVGKECVSTCRLRRWQRP